LTFKGKTILVTGGAGSIGSALVKKLLEYDPKSIRILDIDEYGLFKLRSEVKDEKVRLLLGDIRNSERVRLAVKGVDIVFHTAALKHVGICQYNPDEAIETDIIGTLNVVKSSLEEQSVKKFIYLSSDKAVNPNAIYGCCKLLGEFLVNWANQIQQNDKKFATVRFCNVWETRGNINEIWHQQMSEGKPLTVTSKDMVRYFTSLPEAIALIIKAAVMADGGEIFVPHHVAASNIYELASKMSGNIEIIGIRPGEKLVEQLLTNDEKDRSQLTDDFYIIRQV